MKLLRTAGVRFLILALVDVRAATGNHGSSAATSSAPTIGRPTTIAGRKRPRRFAGAPALVPSSVDSGAGARPVEVRGGGVAASSDEDVRRLKSRTLNALHLTSFLMVASTSMVVFSPLPSLTRHLADSSSSTSSSFSPQARAIQILSLLSAISASVELFLSPLVGLLIDGLGRKLPSVMLNGLIVAANVFVVCNPGVWSICLSRMVNVVVGGFLVIVANSVIADVFAKSSDDGRDDGSEQMGSVLGRHAACISLGFLLGSMAGGRLTEYGDERTPYFASLAVSVLALLNVSFRMIDSMQFTRDDGAATTMESSIGRAVTALRGDDVNKPWDVIASAAGGLGNKVLEAPLSSVQLLFHYGRRMRTLALLMCLQSIPVYMGDVFQLFAREEWGLNPKDFANIVALFGILGIVSNISLQPILQSLGLRNFSLFAIVSSLLFPVTTLLSESYRPVLVAGVLGMFGGAQKVGTSAAMTSLANELSIPQGKLQGEKASMLALLKIGSPIVYGALYLKGKEWGGGGDDNVAGLGAAAGRTIGRKLPFVLNVFLGLCALAVTWQNL